MKQIKLLNIQRPHKGLPVNKAPKVFDIIYCDPPWSYNEMVMRGKNKAPTGSAEDHYPTMSIDELKRLPVGEIAAKNSLCIMWTTGPQLDVSIELLEKWSFKYITIGFCWHKCRVLPSSYFMSSVEIAIVGKKGSIPKERATFSEEQFLSRPRTRHSEKPEEFRHRIDRSWPNANKIELFSRTAAPGWWTWGNQSPECVFLPALDIPW